MATKIKNKVRKWGEKYLFNMLILNTLLVFMVLMRSAGYFHPFFEISVNFIVFLILILSIFLLNFNSRMMFFISLLFWIFACLIKLLKIDIWAERTAVYTFESLIVGLVLLIVETVKKK
jgi:hypothetical protein